MDQPQLSIKQQRELKRQAKLDRREGSARQGRSRRWWLWGGGFVLVGGVIAGMVYLAQPADAPDGDAAVQGLQANDHVLGATDAPAVLIEYSDLQCPACKSYHPLMKQLQEAFGDQLAIVYRHYPLRQIHPHAYAAALAVEGANAQGKFWEYQDLLFERQGQWSTASNPRDSFIEYADELKLDQDKFKKDMDSSESKNRVDADVSTGNQAGVQGTPSFFLNNQRISNPATFDAFKKLVEDAIKDRPLKQTADTTVHLHADLSVVVDGQAIDFTQTKYQSTKDNELSPKVHFHSGVGKVFHVHQAKTTLNDLLTSLKMKLTKDCLTLDNGEDRCTDANTSLKFFVNGEDNAQFGDYQPKDLDRIVVAYGDMTPAELTETVAGVSDEACIYSETCPERGAPPTEECVGGLGTDCE